MDNKPTPNGIPSNNTDEDNNPLIKELYGIPHERGGTQWLDQCPDFLQSSAQQSPSHALILRYEESRTDEAIAKGQYLRLASINIQSPYLKKVVRKVLGNYPGENVDSEVLGFEAPFWWGVHCWSTLQACRKSEEDDDGVGEKEKREFDALLSTLHETLSDTIRDATNLTRKGNVTFNLLWTLFPLGVPVLGRLNGKWHAFLVNGVKYLMTDIPPQLAIEILHLDHDGERFGWTKTSVFVPAFSGTIRIAELPVVPLPFVEDLDSVLETVYARGDMAVKLMAESPGYHAYEGPVKLHRPWDDEIEVFVEGRIMIAPRAHSQTVSRYCPNVYTTPHKLEYLLTRDSETKLASSAQDRQRAVGLPGMAETMNQHPIMKVGRERFGEGLLKGERRSHPLTESFRWTEALYGLRPAAFCRSVVRGYCLTSKSWAEFEIDNIMPVRWNKDAFGALVIPPARKRLLEALVRQQQKHKAEFDDVVQGKGQGLIMLLAGPPGTGKTLTAESVADHLQLPLYAVSASELGDSAKEIKSQFGQVLRLAASWNAVLLIDEADAFLEKRVDTPEARERNKRVAAFLRILEYYKGILILTTNRRVNFDDAFYSRIHLNLTFQALDQKSREGIWKNFLRDSQVDSKDVAAFASEDINGRQIKNIVKMARLLAEDEKAPLRSDHIRDVLSVAREDIDAVQ